LSTYYTVHNHPRLCTTTPSSLVTTNACLPKLDLSAAKPQSRQQVSVRPSPPLFPRSLLPFPHPLINTLPPPLTQTSPSLHSSSRHPSSFLHHGGS
jgi:hypothetical protein